jgi:hypothetical protein
LNEEYISGGYFVTREIEIPTYNRWLRDVCGATEDLVPTRIISIAFDGAADPPLFDWVGVLGEDYDLFGVHPELMAEKNAWANERYNTEIGYPNVFYKLETAREYVQRFTKKLAHIHIVGIGLHKDFLPRVEEAERLQPERKADNGATIAGLADSGFGRALSFAQPCIPGEILGFDIICWFYNIDRTWHSNGLAVDGFEKFNFRPNQYGLIDNKTDADNLGRYADEIQPESGVWLPVLVTRYPLNP